MMLSKLLSLLILSALALFLTGGKRKRGIGNPQSEVSEKPVQQRNSSATDSHQPTRHIQKITSPIEVSIIQPHPEEEQKWRDDQKAFWDRQLAVARKLNRITLLAGLAALAGLYVLYLQADAAKIAAQAALGQFHVSLRPWISPTHKIHDDRLTVSKDGGIQIYLDTTVENVGQSIAMDLSSWNDMLILDATMDKEAAIVRLKQQCDANLHPDPKSRPIQEVLFPKQTMSMPPSHIGLTKKQLSEAKFRNGEVKIIGLAIIGCISYRASFESPESLRHQTRFIYQLYEIEKVANMISVLGTVFDVPIADRFKYVMPVVTHYSAD
jgi:hypothetical protein